ncbi:flavin reductase family protein [Actinopolymorpha rutila]|nr:flavin reductase family protein [Actinopolymorpha rutila]
MARFASGVTIVTTCLDGVDHAMTASAFTSVSLSPPLVLVCVEKIARFHSAVLSAGTWGVSVLTDDHHHVATRLAHRGRPLRGQLDGIPVHRGLTGAALLSAAAARLECRTVAVHDGGDHSIVVGEVVGSDTPPDPAPALVYYAGGYHAVSTRTDPDLQV